MLRRIFNRILTFVQIGKEITSRNKGVRDLSVICIVIFAIQSLLKHIAPLIPGISDLHCYEIFTAIFGLYYPLTLRWAYWQPLTYSFLHGSFWHLFLNLFTIIFMGYAVEQILGRRRFWLIFLLSGIVGGIGWLIFDYHEAEFWYAIINLSAKILDNPDKLSLLQPVGKLGFTLAQRWGEQQNPGMPHLCIGASAGGFGLIGAFVALAPKSQITLLLLYLFPVKLQARYMALILALFTIIELLTSFGNVAYIAHLGGGIAGYLLAKFIIIKTKYRYNRTDCI